MTVLAPSAPQVFNFQGNQVRTIISADGEPRWIAADVCTALGIKNHRDAVKRLDEDGVGNTDIIDRLGRKQTVNAINESGLYELIFQSRVPAAQEFKRWVTHEVLPSIRRRGGYLTPEATEAALTDPDFIIRLATSLKEERQRRAELEAQAALNAPKVVFADAVSVSRTSILVGDLAKILKGNGVDVGATRLFRWMREHGFLINRKGSDWNSPTQKSMELGLFKIKETVVTHSDGHTTINKTPKVTGKGQQYFIERFLDGRFNISAA